MEMKKETDKTKKVLISLKGLPAFAGEEEAFELTTDGEFSQKNETLTFKYLESTLTGQAMGGSLTTFDVEPDRVILRRSDSMSGDMIFNEKQKHFFLHETPFGAIVMGIDTLSITKDMNDDGGNIEIRYDIEVDNVAVSRNLFKIDIKSLPQ